MASNAPSKTKSDILKDMEQPILLGIGANLDSHFRSPESTIRRAIASLGSKEIRVVRQSPLYQTPCFPVGAGPDYVNAVVEVETRLGPEQILATLHTLEAEFGRERDGRWAGRTLDIDLLACGDLVAPDVETVTQWINLDLDAQKVEAPDQLLLPHPRIQDRGFVLIPLADIAPDWRHPLFGKTVSELLQELSPADRADIRRLSP